MAPKRGDIRNFLLTQPTLFDVEKDESDVTIDPAEAARRSEVAKVALDKSLQAHSKEVVDTDGKQMPCVTWMDEYYTLLKGGWPWRVAAYIAWASSKKIGRYPETQEALATEMLGLTSDRAISTWRRKNECIDEAIGIMQTRSMWDYRADAFEAMGIAASDPTKDGNRDRKLLFQMTGDWQPSLRVEDERKPGTNDMAQKSDAELDQIIQQAKAGNLDE